MEEIYGQTPPPRLEAVRKAVLGTEIGQNTAQFLGVSEDSVTPIDVSQTVSSVAGVVTSSVEQRVSKIVSDQIAAQVVKQYEQLPVLQKDQVMEIICKHKE